MHAAVFHQLHQGPEVLVLANCWDAGSARLIASLGARALATSSAAVAWSHGYPDGDAFPIEILLATVREIRRVADLPLSVDAEAGYSDDPGAVADTVAGLVEAGAVGINLEDGRGPPALLAAKIERIKARLGPGVFVNARTDVYLKGLVAPPDRVGETLARAARYREAGADGIFAPGMVAPDELYRVASQLAAPLNVLAMPGLPALPQLAALGVRRLSAGSRIAEAIWGRTTALAREFLAGGVSDRLVEQATPYGEINPMFSTASAPPRR